MIGLMIAAVLYINEIPDRMWDAKAGKRTLITRLDPQTAITGYALLMAAAILGDSTGYAIGFKTGPRIFTREDSRVWSRRHLIRTREFYERYGGKTIVLARFIPIIRTFAPVVAGVGQMDYRRFLFYNVFGGIGWVASLTWAGFLLGHTIPNISQHVHIIVAVVVVLSVLPIVWEVIKARRRKPPTPVPAP